jgi:hypothetical protein
MNGWLLRPPSVHFRTTSEEERTMELLIVCAVIAGLVWVVWVLCGKPSSTAITVETQEQLEQKRKWLENCCDSHTAPQMICGPIPSGLDVDEEALGVFPNVNLMEARAVRYSRGAYAGPTIRIAKGLSFRLGASQGQSTSVDELRVIDHGTLLLTSKRLAFLGSMRTNSVALEDLISIEPYSDGIAVHRERKQKAENYALTRPLIINGGDGNGFAVNGQVMKFGIEIAKVLREIGVTKPTKPTKPTGEKSNVIEFNLAS